MRAAVYTRYGPPEVVRLSEVADAEPGVDELLVRVHATTVNRTDCGVRGADPVIVRLFTGLTKPRQTILGSEFAGEIEAVGRDVTSFAQATRCSASPGSVTCPCHGSRFSLRDGSIERGPATARQPVFETRESDGRIEVRLPAA